MANNPQKAKQTALFITDKPCFMHFSNFNYQYFGILVLHLQLKV